MTKLLIFVAFMLLICEKNVANYALLQCKTFSLKIWLYKIFDKYHVCPAVNENPIDSEAKRIAIRQSEEKGEHGQSFEYLKSGRSNTVSFI